MWPHASHRKWTALFTIHFNEILTAGGCEGDTQLHLDTATCLGGAVGNAQTTLKSATYSTVPLKIEVRNWPGGINTWKCGKAGHGERLHREDESALTASP